jgi:hypothetical protein
VDECHDHTLTADVQLFHNDPGTEFSAPFDIVQHCLPQDAIHACLIPFAALLQPGNHIGVQPHGDGLLHGTIEPSPQHCPIVLARARLSTAEDW